MAATYILIASNTLSSSAASVTFSSIPGTYTDLILRFSARSDSALGTDVMRMYYNGQSATTNHSITQMRGNGATATSGRSTSAANQIIGIVNDTTTTSDTFTSVEIYIPSYTVSQNKPSSIFPAQENNGTTAYVYGIAGLFRDTTAISQMNLIIGSGANFVSGSSFFLYGIKNS